MAEYRIAGGRPLSGTLRVQGAKNSVLPILAATLLVRGECVIGNCPDLSDVRASVRILEHLGCRVRREKGRRSWTCRASSAPWEPESGGAGSSVITVEGGVPLHGGSYSVMGDRIAAATHLAAVAAAGGEAELTGVDYRHLSTVIAALSEAGAGSPVHRSVS